MKFLIKMNHSEMEKLDGQTVFGTGETPFIHVSEDLKREVISDGKVKFKTGLFADEISTNPTVAEESKKVYSGMIAKAKEKIKSLYGADSLDPTNDSFWKTRAKIVITNNTFSTVYDTEADVNHLILFHQIIGNGYASISASEPNEDSASGRRFYMIAVDDFEKQTYKTEYGDKRKAIALLDKLVTKSNTEALCWIAWVINDQTTKGFTPFTSLDTLDRVLMDYIEGKHLKRATGAAKKACSDKFVAAATEYTLDPNASKVKGIITAAVDHDILFKKEGKLTSSTRLTPLASTLEGCYDILTKSDNLEEFLEIKAEVLKKLQ